MVNLEYCAAYYANQWLTSERYYYLAFRSDEKSIRRQSLKKAINFFGVARNLPRKYDVEIGMYRYEPIFEILDELEAKSVKLSNYLDIFESTLWSISDKYGGKKLISLTSKLLWLKFQDPFIIYDSRVREALDVAGGHYELFVETWIKQYEPLASRVSDISKRLPSIFPYVTIDDERDDRREIASICNRKWFHKRVFDMYLWHSDKLSA